MKAIDERVYPPARWCPSCRRLHNGGVVPRQCPCGEPTIPVPKDLFPPSERGPLYKRKG